MHPGTPCLIATWPPPWQDGVLENNKLHTRGPVGSCFSRLPASAALHARGCSCSLKQHRPAAHPQTGCSAGVSAHASMWGPRVQHLGFPGVRPPAVQHAGHAGQLPGRRPASSPRQPDPAAVPRHAQPELHGAWLTGASTPWWHSLRRAGLHGRDLLDQSLPWRLVRVSCPEVHCMLQRQPKLEAGPAGFALPLLCLQHAS